MSKRLTYLGLALLGGVLPAIGWPPHKLSFLLFFAFVPFLLLETHFVEKKRGIWFGLYAYLGLFVFNLITTWWVWNASPGGAVFMLFANSFLMLIPFLSYRFCKKILGQGRGLLMFIATWLTFEYFHFRWDLNYPWLTLGNGFATSTSLVQWYEYTGAPGGSLWILLSNALIFLLVTQYKRSIAVCTALLLLVPIGWSWILGRTQNTCKAKNEILIIQPNIDPYKKFDAGKDVEQLELFLKLCQEGVTPDTRLIVLPETALVGNTNETYLSRSYAVRQLKAFLSQHPGVGMLIGASTHRFYKEGESLPPYPRYYEPEDRYYDSYNTAVQLKSDGSIELYHKSKLVPGVESLPFPQFFKEFDAILKLDFGGESGNLGKDKQAKTFYYEAPDTTSKPQLGVAPLICYESIFGEYVGDFVRKKATVLAVITNDGWWKNTAGHKQHMHYARLRAIEYRRYVIRSANTGISCVIDDNGNVLEELGWWQEGSIRARVPSLTYETFYSRSGDYLGKLAVFIFVFMGLSIVVKWRVQKSELK
ncbi:MAG: apolipoprotein N-acyltransferase [Bacteroidia bacterium]|nr:apolipoprotein N-acyltransferase [Bacteroidia bacterium]